MLGNAEIPQQKACRVAEIRVVKNIGGLDVAVKYFLICKGLKQRQEITSQTDGDLHSVSFDTVLLERTEKFHHRTVIPGIARNVCHKRVKILHDMRLAVLLQLLQDLQLALVENIIGIGRFMLLRHSKDIISVA